MLLQKKVNLEILKEKISFRDRTERLDWKRIASIDIDNLIHEGDTSQLADLISPVTFCKADAEFDGSIDPGFIKVFRISQLIAECLLTSQERFAQRLTNLQEKYNETEQEKKKLSEEVLHLKETLTSAKKELKKRKEMLASSQNEILGQNNSDEYDQCPYCTKKFLTSGFLLAHIQRRHQGLPVNPLHPSLPPGAPTALCHHSQTLVSTPQPQRSCSCVITQQDNREQFWEDKLASLQQEYEKQIQLLRQELLEPAHPARPEGTARSDPSSPLPVSQVLSSSEVKVKEKSERHSGIVELRVNESLKEDKDTQTVQRRRHFSESIITTEPQRTHQSHVRPRKLDNVFVSVGSQVDKEADVEVQSDEVSDYTLSDSIVELTGKLVEGGNNQGGDEILTNGFLLAPIPKQRRHQGLPENPLHSSLPPDAPTTLSHHSQQMLSSTAQRSDSFLIAQLENREQFWEGQLASLKHECEKQIQQLRQELLEPHPTTQTPRSDPPSPFPITQVLSRSEAKIKEDSDEQQSGTGEVVNESLKEDKDTQTAQQRHNFPESITPTEPDRINHHAQIQRGKVDNVFVIVGNKMEKEADVELKSDEVSDYTLSESVDLSGKFDEGCNKQSDEIRRRRLFLTKSDKKYQHQHDEFIEQSGGKSPSAKQTPVKKKKQYIFDPKSRKLIDVAPSSEGEDDDDEEDDDDHADHSGNTADLNNMTDDEDEDIEERKARKSQLDLVRAKTIMELEQNMTDIGLNPESTAIGLEEMGRALKHLKFQRRASGDHIHDFEKFEEERNAVKTLAKFEATKSSIDGKLSAISSLKAKKTRSSSLVRIFSAVKTSGKNWRKRVHAQVKSLKRSRKETGQTSQSSAPTTLKQLKPSSSSPDIQPDRKRKNASPPKEKLSKASVTASPNKAKPGEDGEKKNDESDSEWDLEELQRIPSYTFHKSSSENEGSISETSEGGKTWNEDESDERLEEIKQYVRQRKKEVGSDTSFTGDDMDDDVDYEDNAESDHVEKRSKGRNMKPAEIFVKTIKP